MNSTKKTRIKVVTRPDGTKEHYPQYYREPCRFLLFFKQPGEWHNIGHSIMPRRFLKREEAERCIDHYLNPEKYVNYVKYPK